MNCNLASPCYEDKPPWYPRPRIRADVSAPAYPHTDIGFVREIYQGFSQGIESVIDPPKIDSESESIGSRPADDQDEV
ncbi:hypothetical protein [Novipirellula aureliae]|uniref:hypothetical protein n=1 Tax=Novipirellula aureliae TaxID=2527966 RepID=UPI0011B719F1|nr:hypothetical protein [Novipirellula aureliae]